MKLPALCRKDELNSVSQERYFVPTDFYLIYDDEEMYRQVVGMTE